jgi:hypothetical protein
MAGLGAAVNLFDYRGRVTNIYELCPLQQEWFFAFIQSTALTKS